VETTVWCASAENCRRKYGLLSSGASGMPPSETTYENARVGVPPDGRPQTSSRAVTDGAIGDLRVKNVQLPFSTPSGLAVIPLSAGDPPGGTDAREFVAAGVALAAGCGTIARARSNPVESPASLPPRNAAQVVKGRQVYLNGCASGHGQFAQGARNWQHPDQRGDLPAPPHDAKGHTWRHSDAQLTQIVRDGWRDPFNKTPELTMPAFKRLPNAEIVAVIEYFKRLWTEDERRYQQRLNESSPARDGGK